ncbi:hypothetical protein [Helcococcus bovis]
MIAEQFSINQKALIKRIMLSIAIFIPAIAILIFAKSDKNGFNFLWR